MIKYKGKLVLWNTRFYNCQSIITRQKEMLKMVSELVLT